MLAFGARKPAGELLPHKEEVKEQLAVACTL